jgi:hypothetical protein
LESPPQTRTYDPLVLSEDEKRRFLYALGDGFGYSHRSKHLEEKALPGDVRPGLLQHRAYFYKNRTSEYWGDEEEGEFWETSDGDSPPGLFEQCPLGFYLPLIRQYFAEQKTAYLNQAKTSDRYNWLGDLTPDERRDWDQQIYDQALYETYSKAWYEHHINFEIYSVDEAISILERHAKKGISLNLGTLLLTSSSAVLGRLIEQYYWKFLIEKSAIRGAKISEAAKAGGNVLASKRRAEQTRWQVAANLIWKERPESSKKTIAAILKKRLNIAQSLKQITRVLVRPQK